MNKEQVRSVLSGVLDVEPVPYRLPTQAEWQRLEERFATQFPAEFKIFIEFMAEFSFPGEIYNVGKPEESNGNDLIETIYEAELALGWPKDLVPFYGIGNGDYFALDRREGVNTGVYYRYHEDGRVERYSTSFEEWLGQLPLFLRGEASL